MDTRHIPAILFGAAVVSYIAYVSSSFGLLPERVATHFNIHGAPDDWMTRSGYLSLMLAMGLGLPAFIIGLCLSTPWLPAWMVNLPNKQYWLSSSERPFTSAYLFWHSFWMASLMVGFFAALHQMTILANRSLPVHLPGREFGVLIAVFIAGTAVWTIALRRRFRRVSQA